MDRHEVVQLFQESAKKRKELRLRLIEITNTKELTDRWNDSKDELLNETTNTDKTTAIAQVIEKFERRTGAHPRLVERIVLSDPEILEELDG
jgi:hypothetical protein